jgi:hypothetical protein
LNDGEPVETIIILLSCIILRAHLEDLGVDGWIIPKWIFKLWVGDVDWIDVAQDRNKWSDRVKAVMNFLVS